jgi:hypothetical protein
MSNGSFTPLFCPSRCSIPALNAPLKRIERSVKPSIIQIVSYSQGKHLQFLPFKKAAYVTVPCHYRKELPANTFQTRALNPNELLTYFELGVYTLL